MIGIIKGNLINLIVLVVISGTIYFSSCSGKNPTTGTLGVTVVDSLGNPVIWNTFYLATSQDNLRNSIYSDSGITDDHGKIRFLYLSPNFYWYRAKYWSNFASIQINAGNDYYATLEVTTHSGH